MLALAAVLATVTLPLDGAVLALMPMPLMPDGWIFAAAVASQAHKALVNLVASTSDPAFAVTRDGHVVAWNQVAERVLGHPAAHALGRRCWDLLAGLDVFGNRYCCEGCPVRNTAFTHQPVRSSKLNFRPAQGQRHFFDVFMLLVRIQDGSEVLVHVCRSRDRCRPSARLEPDNGTRPLSRERKALTPRELELLKLVADGMETADIAAHMCISLSTVRHHLQGILHKLQVHNRTAAVVKAQQARLI